MNDDYQKMSELLDNWLSNSEKEIKLAFIEKEILLEKVRKLYVKLATVETEEYIASKTEIPQNPTENEPKKEFTPAKTLEEDIDLFFDTEHESYKVVEQDLEIIAKEIDKAQEQPVVPKTEPKKATTLTTDIFDNIEKMETPIKAEDAPLTDNADELFIEPDFEINAQPEKPVVEKAKPVVEKVPEVKKNPDVKKVEVEKIEDIHEEDDILQFIPPKSATQPAKTEPQKIKKDKPQPEPVQKQSEPKQGEKKPETPKESPLQKAPQRSLNDLFNERREDHSISSQYQHAKVGDLTKAISINDKFIYIKELFHNRGEDFSSAIRQLNECKNMEEAFDCLEQLKQKFFWDSKSDAYLSFCDLLRRKYS